MNVFIYHNFPHYPQAARFSYKIFLDIKYWFLFSLYYLFDTFLIQRRIQPDIITNTHGCSCKLPAILANCLPYINKIFILSTDFRKIIKYHIS